jgi:hypothetical protein
MTSVITSVPDPSLFGSGFQDGNKKIGFSVSFFCLFLSVGIRTLTLVFKDNISLRSHNPVEIIVYPNFLFVHGRLRI